MSKALAAKVRRALYTAQVMIRLMDMDGTAEAEAVIQAKEEIRQALLVVEAAT